MVPPDNIASLIPARRNDEPPTLRDQIVREILDHLECAVQRELLRQGGNEAEARRRALAKFGNPAKVARQLWFDAMREKIMSQRLTFVALVIVTLTSFASTGLTWYLIDGTQQVNQALLQQSSEANAALLSDSRKTNEEILRQLAALAASSNTPTRSMEWNHLKVRLSAGEAGGAPAAGVVVKIKGHILDTAKETTLSRTTGADGIADFGQVRPGNHKLIIETPWGESNSHRSVHGPSVVVMPGEAKLVEAVIPAPLEQAEISVSVDWPADLQSRGLWIVCDLVRPAREFDGQTWIVDADNGLQVLAINPSGGLINFDLQKLRHSQTFGQDLQNLFNLGIMAPNGRLGTFRLHSLPHDRIYFGLPANSVVPRLNWPAGSYRVRHLVIAEEPSVSDEVPLDELLAPLYVAGIQFDAIDEDKDKERVNWDRLENNQFQPLRRKKSGERIEVPTFEAVGGRLNEWRLTPPKPLLDRLRERLEKSSER